MSELPASLREAGGKVVMDVGGQLRAEVQLLLYVYHMGCMEWELIVHDELPSHQVAASLFGQPSNLEEEFSQDEGITRFLFCKQHFY